MKKSTVRESPKKAKKPEDDGDHLKEEVDVAIAPSVELVAPTPSLLPADVQAALEKSLGKDATKVFSDVLGPLFAVLSESAAEEVAWRADLTRRVARLDDAVAGLAKWLADALGVVNENVRALAPPPPPKEPSA